MIDQYIDELTRPNDDGHEPWGPGAVFLAPAPRPARWRSASRSGGGVPVHHAAALLVESQHMHELGAEPVGEDGALALHPHFHAACIEIDAGEAIRVVATAEPGPAPDVVITPAPNLLGKPALVIAGNRMVKRKKCG